MTRVVDVVEQPDENQNNVSKHEEHEVRDQQNKITIVSFSDAVIDSSAVVIEDFNAVVTLPAMVTPRWPVDLTGGAVFVLFFFSRVLFGHSAHRSQSNLFSRDDSGLRELSQNQKCYRHQEIYATYNWQNPRNLSPYKWSAEH